ncbi:hypothetical protein L1887_60181 [Cichorium endivia]|nr:hypothetical protein L1887_60181 [Cichorium endivia]
MTILLGRGAATAPPWDICVRVIVLVRVQSVYFVLDEVDARLLLRVPWRTFFSFFCVGLLKDESRSFSRYDRGRLPEAIRDDLRAEPGSAPPGVDVELVRLMAAGAFLSGDGERSRVEAWKGDTSARSAKRHADCSGCRLACSRELADVGITHAIQSETEHQLGILANVLLPDRFIILLCVGHLANASRGWMGRFLSEL